MVKKFILLPIKCFWPASRRLFWGGLWLLGLGLLAWYPLRWWPGDSFWPVRLVNYMMPWLLAALTPALLITLLAQRRGLAVTLAIPTLLVGLTFAPLFLPRPNIALAGDASYRVMSYNIWGRNRDVAALAGVIGQEQPDILLLQEVNPEMAGQLRAALAEFYAGHELYLAYEPGLGQAIISRYPLAPVAAEWDKGRAQKVLANTPAGPVAVWNVHTSQPLPWFWQYRQIAALAADIAAVDTPLIVAGDFNTTDQSETYRLINEHLGNAHWDAGWGFGFSFPAQIRQVKKIPLVTPLVRIDHIFYSRHFFAYQARTLADSGGSDHLPVVTQLSLLKEN
ncbi:MAG: endonuclease/exonuclease/phosphatase family protein [Chloroflexota bacterium]